MRFDRKAPGGGMVVYTKVENGKCLLEFQFFYEKSGEQEADVVYYENVHSVEIELLDEADEKVFFCKYPIREEELAKGLLLHPHLWNGLEAPYLYRVKVKLLTGEGGAGSQTVDELKCILPLRSLRYVERKGWYLNEKPFEIRPVLYIPSVKVPEEVFDLEQTKEDLELLGRMGANTICLEDRTVDREFLELCEKMGFVLWWVAGQNENAMPQRATSDKMKGECADGNGNWQALQEVISRKMLQECNGRLLMGGEQHTPTDLYYYYKACWSKEPFVHIVSNSLKYQENAQYSLQVYSNQKRVALYVDGVLYEVRVGAPEYLFEGITEKKKPLLLTVEAGECRKSMTFYKED